MSNLDAHVASVLDTSHSDDEDALIASLEDSPAFDAFREQRIQQLHSELSRAKAQKNQGFGNYTEIKEEKALMELTTEELAKQHFDTRFLKMHVENAPFLVAKLKVQVLPCVLAFIDGLSVDRIIGFEGLGYTPDNFSTKDLEARLLTSGVLQRAKATEGSGIKYDSKTVLKEDSDDDDWD